MLKITKCLRDTCELVRRQTFILLSRLLQVNFYHITVFSSFSITEDLLQGNCLIKLQFFYSEGLCEVEGSTFSSISVVSC